MTDLDMALVRLSGEGEGAAVRGGIGCTLSDNVIEVIAQPGSAVVVVRGKNGNITSADGRVSLTNERGEHLQASTSALYVAAARAQGIPVVERSTAEPDLIIDHPWAGVVLSAREAIRGLRFPPALRGALSTHPTEGMIYGDGEHWRRMSDGSIVEC